MFKRLIITNTSIFKLYKTSQKFYPTIIKNTEANFYFQKAYQKWNNQQYYESISDFEKTKNILENIKVLSINNKETLINTYLKLAEFEVGSPNSKSIEYVHKIKKLSPFRKRTSLEIGILIEYEYFHYSVFEY